MDIAINRHQREDVLDDLHLRIQEIALDLRRLGRRQLFGRVHALKGLARSRGFGVLADLCRGLEQALADEPGSAIVTAYLDRMVDAVACDDDPRCADTLLASVGVRFVG